jgi:hypothetical protein
LFSATSGLRRGEVPDSELEALKAQAKDFVARTTANVTKAEGAISAWEADPASTPGIPNLPPGTTLDLTHPTVKLPDVPEFTIPGI